MPTNPSVPTELNLEEMVPEDLTRDKLTDEWDIFQLKKGHRFSVDDQITAWVATQTVPNAHKICDLGAGIGSVGLMALHLLPNTTTLTMVEAQRISHQLAQRTIAENDLQDRVTLIHSDLRQLCIENRDVGTFPLVTGSPPYFPLGSALISPHPQRAACRMELRGSIVDYALAAKKLLSPEGSFVFCMPTNDPRATKGVESNGLHIWEKRDVLFRVGRPPTISIFTAKPTPIPRMKIHTPFVVRDSTGNFTDEFQSIRLQFGFVQSSKRT